MRGPSFSPHEARWGYTAPVRFPRLLPSLILSDLSKAKLGSAADWQMLTLRSSTPLATNKPFLSSHSEAADCSSGPAVPLQREEHTGVEQSRKSPRSSCLHCHSSPVRKLQFRSFSMQPLPRAPDPTFPKKTPPTTLEKCGRLCGNCYWRQIEETILSVQGNKFEIYSKKEEKQQQPFKLLDSGKIPCYSCYLLSLVTKLPGETS